VSLEQTQKRLWRLIAWPEGVRPALQTEPEGTPDLATLVTSDERLAAEDRLDVYANAYFYRILEVIEDELPGLRRGLGADAFNDLVTSYLVVHPSRDPSIRWVARALPAFLREHEAVASIRAAFPWSPDLATLEWAMSEAFDAADATPLTRADLAELPAEQWPQLRLEPVPAARRLDLAWPVGSLRRAWREEDDAGLEPSAAAAPVDLRPEPRRLLIWRHEDIVSQRALADDEADAFDAIVGGASFGALCERIADTAGDEEAPALAATWLSRWVDEAVLA
jgi:hypothetical protein